MQYDLLVQLQQLLCHYCPVIVFNVVHVFVWTTAKQWHSWNSWKSRQWVGCHWLRVWYVELL